MKRKSLTHLGETEMEVLHHVWDLEEATVAQVRDRILEDRDVAYTTVMTVLKTLAEKGYLAYHKEGRSYVYEPAQQPDEVQHSLLQRLMNKVFHGSPTALVQTLVQREELTDTERSEIKEIIDALEGSGMRIHIPDPETVARIERAARETGDEATLSRTDVRLLATAFELDATLVTDDYAMQNVADRLDVAVEVIAREGIDERRDWRFQCQGCGREFDDSRDRCPICGSELTRKNPA
jgi:rRNA maturation endonuclease Nob1